MYTSALLVWALSPSFCNPMIADYWAPDEYLLGDLWSNAGLQSDLGYKRSEV